MPVFSFLLYYLAARTVMWTLLLYLTQPVPPMDVLEHLAWGREWQLVYAHHPGLPAWLNEIFYSAGGTFALSLLSPLCTAAALGAAYYTARLFVAPLAALVCTLSLEGVIYFNVLAVEFNHNTAQLAACAWLVGIVGRLFLSPTDGAGAGVAGDSNSRFGRLSRWGLLGFVAAVAMMAKYSSLLFLASLIVWSVATPTTRQHWKTVGPWFALSGFVLWNIPQLVALADLHFAPFRFALSRAAGADGWLAHLLYPLRFFAAQVGAFALAAILCTVALIGKGAPTSARDSLGIAPPPDKAQRLFIFAAAFGPLILALLISAVFGLRLKSMWGTAMLTFVPLWVFVTFPRPLRWRRWVVAFVGMAFLAPLAAAAIQLGAPFINGRGKRIHYPGAEIARKAEELWQAAHPAAPLCYVAGPKHIASLVAFYATPRLSAVIDGDWQKSFWTTQEAFLQSGGVVVWVADDGRRTAEPPAVAAELSSGNEVVHSFRWQSPAELPPLKIGFALVAPREINEKCLR